MSDNVNDLVVDNPQTLEQLNLALKRVMKEIKQEEEKVERLKSEASQLAKSKRKSSKRPSTSNRGEKIRDLNKNALHKMRMKRMKEERIGALKKRAQKYIDRRNELMANSSKDSQRAG
jgi:ABC-type nitrate/sulfonate/bicarbonate transport system substrate-binding protein